MAHIGRNDSYYAQPQRPPYPKHEAMKARLKSAHLDMLVPTGESGKDFRLRVCGIGTMLGALMGLLKGFTQTLCS